MTVNPTALQLYTVRDQLATDRAGILKRVAGYGYGAVEPFGITNDPQGLRADLDAAGLSVCSVHAVPIGADAGAVIAAARTLGADTVIVPYLPPPRFADADGVREIAAELNEASARLAGEGMRLGYHNHDWELAPKEGSKTALELLFEAAEGSPLTWQVDLAWLVRGGADPKAWMERYRARVVSAHVKDIAPPGQNADQGARDIRRARRGGQAEPPPNPNPGPGDLRRARRGGNPRRWVARAYLAIYGKARTDPWALVRYLVWGYPVVFRRYLPHFLLALALFAAGTAFGYLASAYDREAARAYLMPADMPTIQPNRPLPRMNSGERNSLATSRTSATGYRSWKATRPARPATSGRLQSRC